MDDSWAGEPGCDLLQPPAHTQLSIELHEACRECERPKSTTPPNRIKLLGNVVWAQLEIVHNVTQS